MKKCFKNVLALILIATLLLAGCAPAEQPASIESPTANAAQALKPEEPQASLPKVAYVTGTGGLGDNQFNDKGYRGIQRLLDEGLVEHTLIETQELAEEEGNLRSLAETGEYKLIVGMGSDMVDAMTTVSSEFLEQNFMIVDGLCGDLPNVLSLKISTNDAAFIGGALAAMCDSVLENSPNKGIIGIIGGMDIPLIRQVIICYTAGARYVNPDIQVLSNFVGSWSDPTTAAEQAQAMFEQGASTIRASCGGSASGIYQTAEKLGRYSMGTDENQNHLAPDAMICSCTRSMDLWIYNTVLAAIDGTFEGGDRLVSLSEDPDALKLEYEGSNVAVPADTKAKLEQVITNLVELEAQYGLPTDYEQLDGYMAKIGTFKD